MHHAPHHAAAALTIAGSDSGGGAGIQADLKTFEALGVFGLSAITALTAQNTTGVKGVFPVPAGFVLEQLAALRSDFRIGAAKTGMLFDPEVIHAVAANLAAHPLPLVCDPVMVATSGDALLRPEALHALQSELLPLATVITPNLKEAAALTGVHAHDEEGMLQAAKALSELYPKAWILVKGGHLEGDEAADLLHRQGQSEWLRSPRIDTQDTHGTGCTLSAAIAAGLSQGLDVPEATRAAKRFLQKALQHAWSGIGHGHGSLRHHLAAP